ncbi:MAG TPA: hypothetical protein VK654_12365 [Nitrospirota bacterium]|nr:hypothetical protein [Nitrospirota bacterium]
MTRILPDGFVHLTTRVGRPMRGSLLDRYRSQQVDAVNPRERSKQA